MFLGGLEILIAKALLGIAIGAAVVTVVVITIAVLEARFDKWREENTVDQDQVGFMVNEGIENGNHKVIQGVFNKRTRIVDGAWKIEGSKIDSDLKNEKVVIFD
jgi:hypothetical protein